MQRILSADEMRRCDETTIRTSGIPGLLLMENAGRSVVEFLHEEFGPLAGQHVVVACGAGNNAGDGFAIARLLLPSGARVTVLHATSPSALRGDTLTNFRLVRKLSRDRRNNLTVTPFSPRRAGSISVPDLVVDAVFGTGFHGDVRSPFKKIIEWIVAQEAPVVSVDIPSGVDATTGTTGSVAVRATATVTFGFAKWGLLCNAGRDAAGEVYAVDIGFPPSATEAPDFRTVLVEPEDVRNVLPKRPRQAHKYSTGKVLVVAGSRGYTGAAALCAFSALRSGAGAVQLMTPDSVYPILAKKLTEAIVQGVPSTDSGSISLRALDAVRERLPWADVLLIGPGLSQDPETVEFVRRLLRDFRGSAVIDADGLNALVRESGARIFRDAGDFILTPHAGEFARLTGMKGPDIETNRIVSAREFAAKQKVTLVLKGAPTVTAGADGSVFVNSTGNPGMATVGSGDVLAGIIAGFRAQGMESVSAATAGVFIHGLAGDEAKSVLGEKSLVAGDVLEKLPFAIRNIESEIGE